MDTPAAVTEAIADASAAAPEAQPAVPESIIDQPDPKTYDAAYVAGLKAEAIANRQRAKAAEEKAKQWDAAQDANKSELERAMERAAQAEAKAAAVNLEMLRQKVAADKNLPRVIVDRLKGTTEEEIAADAERIAAEITKQYQPTGVAGKHTGAGAVAPTTDYAAMKPSDFVKMVRERR